MSEDPKAEELITAADEYWKHLVSFCLTSKEPSERLVIHLSRNGTHSPGMKRKVDAIRNAVMHGATENQIVGWGQSLTLSAYAIRKKNGNNEKYRQLRWRVPMSLADAVENETVPRIAKVCNLKTSEELWEFINSVFAHMPDHYLRMYAGEPKLKRER